MSRTESLVLLPPPQTVHWQREMVKWKRELRHGGRLFHGTFVQIAKLCHIFHNVDRSLVHDGASCRAHVRLDDCVGLAIVAVERLLARLGIDSASSARLPQPGLVLEPASGTLYVCWWRGRG